MNFNKFSSNFHRISALFLVFFATAAFAETIMPQHLCPTHWWVGMKNPRVEILVHQKEIGKCAAKLQHYKGVKLAKTIHTENANYAFLEVDIAENAKAGTLVFEFTPENGKPFTVNYTLKTRDVATKVATANANDVATKVATANANDVATKVATPISPRSGLTSADFIYLLMPDRFSNGDKTNDVVKGMNDVRCNRDSGFVRHGGDLQGVVNHLDYLQNLGVTALWLTPVFENNQPFESYHGYAFTDHYKVDARLGTNELYQKLVNEAHAKGLKIVMDLVHNHIGNKHWLYQDLPAKDWVHQWSEFTRTTYRATTLLDPYASKKERTQLSDGWFDKHMPDMNQKNAQVANYFIQNNIWWIEEYGIDAFRVDTYAYPDQDFMRKWTTCILDEYPQFGIFGETWVQGIGVQAFFAKNNVKDPPKNLVSTRYRTYTPANLPGVTDFQLYYAIQEGVTKEMGWTEGIQQVYHTLAVDYIYDNPFKNVVFLDNHDLSRFYSVVKEDLSRFKLGVALQLTTRGIPQWYYGDEILMKNYASLSGVEAREDFPGGWEGDKINKFDSKNLNEKELEAFTFVKKLANFRKNSNALKYGKLMQFVPNNGVYTYFRYTSDETLMIMINTDKAEQIVDCSHFDERTKGFSSAENVLTNEQFSTIKTIKIPSNTAFVLKLR